MIQGQASLDLFDFGVLLQALANNLKVGVLAIRSGGRRKYLELDRNKIVSIYTKQPRVSLAKVLYNHRSADKATLKTAIDAMAADPSLGLLGDCLVASGAVSVKRVSSGRLYQMIEEVLELFYWKNVGFEFYSDKTLARFDSEGLERVGEPVQIQKILIRCARITDDIAKFNEVTPSLRDVYGLEVTSLEELERIVPDTAQREFMLLLDGVRDMREVLRDMRMNRFEVLEFFYRFRKQGLIEPKNAFELLMLAENRRSEFSLTKRTRILERVNELGVEGFKVLGPLAETYEAMGNPGRAAHFFACHARKCVQDGDLPAAVAAVSRAAALTPDDADLRRFEVNLLERHGEPDEIAAAHRGLAAILRAKGDVADAVKSLEASCRADPANAANWRDLAESLADAGRDREAAARARKAGDVLRDAGDVEASEEAYRRALEIFPKAWSPRYRLLDMLHDAGHDDTAVQELGALIEFVDRDLRDEEVSLRMSHLLRLEDRMRGVQGLVSSAAGALGRAYVRIGESERAANIFRESGDALTGARRHRSAAEMYGEVIELCPEDTDVRCKLAREHVAMGDRDRALGQLRRVGSRLMACKDFEKAKGVFDEMLEFDPACLDAHVGLAKALLYLDKVETASAHYHRVGLLHRGCGRAEEAVPYLHEAVQRAPTDAKLLEEYAELLLATDQRTEALKALSALVDLHMSQGEPARAAIALTKILEIDQRHPDAKSILQEAAKRLLRIAQESEEISPQDARKMVEDAKTAAQRTAGQTQE